MIQVGSKNIPEVIPDTPEIDISETSEPNLMSNTQKKKRSITLEPTEIPPYMKKPRISAFQGNIC